jgi:hypothetical protein
MARPPALEGGDPPEDEDEILTGVIPLDHRVSDEEAEAAIRDILGGSGNAAYHAQVIIKRFAAKRWRITKGA